MRQKEEMAPGKFVAWLGIGVIAVLSFALAFVKGGGGVENGVDAFAVLFMFDVVMAFLLFHVAVRRDNLYMATTVELNKLRRIYHVAKNLAAVDRRYREWFTELHGHLYGYLNAFHDPQTKYEDGNAAFRKLSYHVYTIPEIATRKEEVLFAELLDTTAVVAETRQRVSELWGQRIPATMRAVAIIMAIGYSVTVLGSSDSPVFAAFALAMGLSTLFLVFAIDGLLGEHKAIMDRYAKNVSRLELGRDEG